MKIAYYYPSQGELQKEIIITRFSKHTFLHQKCDPTIDLIYSASVSVLKKALEAKRIYHKPLICWVWDIPYNWREWNLTPEGLEANKNRDKVNAARIEMLRECDRIFSASKWTQKILKEQFNLSSEQLYFFIDTHGIDSVPGQVKKNQIIQISRYYYNKKFEHTLEAASGIPNFQTILIGDNLSTPYGLFLKNCAKRNNPEAMLLENIPRKTLLTLLKQSKVLTSPSVFEGWGITPIEALYSGVPVLLSDLEVFQEVYGDTVIYHRRNDVLDMHEQLLKLTSDESLQTRIFEKTAPIIAEFTPEKFIRRWEKNLE